MAELFDQELPLPEPLDLPFLMAFPEIQFSSGWHSKVERLAKSLGKEELTQLMMIACIKLDDPYQANRYFMSRAHAATAAKAKTRR